MTNPGAGGLHRSFNEDRIIWILLPDLAFHVRFQTGGILQFGCAASSNAPGCHIFLGTRFICIDAIFKRCIAARADMKCAFCRRCRPANVAVGGVANAEAII